MPAKRDPSCFSHLSIVSSDSAPAYPLSRRRSDWAGKDARYRTPAISGRPDR